VKTSFFQFIIQIIPFVASALACGQMESREVELAAAAIRHAAGIKANNQDALSANSLDNAILVDGKKYATLQSAVSAAQSAGGSRIVVPPGTYAVSTNLFSGVTVPIDLDFVGPSEVDLTAAQTITSNNISIRFASQNPAITRIGAASPGAPQTSGLRFKATASLSAPMFTVTGPILGFNVSNVHFDCNGNATMAISADRMQTSQWTGIVSADNCSVIGFKFPNNATGPNQDTSFNQIQELFVTRTPACVEFDQNSEITSNFAHNIIQEIACSLLGTSGATDEVYYQGADGNFVGRIWCQIKGGTGSAKSCVHFSASAYSNIIDIIDPSIPGTGSAPTPAIVQDANGSINTVVQLSLNNWLSSGAGNAVGDQVANKGNLVWTDQYGVHPYSSTTAGAARIYLDDTSSIVNGSNQNAVIQYNRSNNIIQIVNTHTRPSISMVVGGNTGFGIQNGYGAPGSMTFDLSNLSSYQDFIFPSEGGIFSIEVASGTTSITASDNVGCVDQTAPATGVTTAMKVIVAPVSPQTNTTWSGYVSATGIVDIRVCTISSLTGSAVTYNWSVIL